VDIILTTPVISEEEFALHYPWYRSDLSTMLLWKKEQAIYPSVEKFISTARQYLRNCRSD
jgi:hypothetical protein